MPHKQVKTYLFIKESEEISPCEIRCPLDYDRGQCAVSSCLKYREGPNQRMRDKGNEIHLRYVSLADKSFLHVFVIQFVFCPVI